MIVLGAGSGIPLSARLLELGATQCLKKPFGTTEFLAAIEAAADSVREPLQRFQID